MREVVAEPWTSIVILTSKVLWPSFLLKALASGSRIKGPAVWAYSALEFKLRCLRA